MVHLLELQAEAISGNINIQLPLTEDDLNP